MLRIHSKMELSFVNGPGRRAVIWVQGCSLACAGCWNPATHSVAGGQTYKVTELLAWLRRLWLDATISGLTLSGGEPLEQAATIEALVTGLRKGIPSMSVGLFSGYTERELVAGRFRSEGLSSARRAESWMNIRACLDFAVLGRFNEQWPSNQPLVSSGNQKLLLVSGRHSPGDFDVQSMEVSIGSDGFTQITGFTGRNDPDRQ